MKMAKAKLEYMIEKYNYNGENIISQNKNFNNELKLSELFEDNKQNININDYDRPFVIALQNLVYHKHEYVTNNSTIEKILLKI